MECTFTCSWFYSYRSDCVAVPCLSVGTSCLAAGAPSGSDCAKWCCVYEPVRGLIFLPVAIAVMFLLCVVGRCGCRWVVTSRRKARAARKAADEDPSYLDDSDDNAEGAPTNVASNSMDSNTWHEPTEPLPLYNRKMVAPTSRSLAYPLDRSSSPPESKDISSLSPAPQQPDLEQNDSDEDEDGHNSRARKPWYA
jgi:hypothetical protein